LAVDFRGMSSSVKGKNALVIPFIKSTIVQKIPNFEFMVHDSFKVAFSEMLFSTLPFHQSLRAS
jgi:hypothetical protein